MSDETMNVLSGFALEEEWARNNGITKRTAARYRAQTDGLPFLRFAGKVHIPIEEARKWAQRRIRHPNSKR